MLDGDMNCKECENDFNSKVHEHLLQVRFTSSSFFIPGGLRFGDPNPLPQSPYRIYHLSSASALSTRLNRQVRFGVAAWTQMAVNCRRVDGGK